jgi:hypothetical protein
MQHNEDSKGFGGDMRVAGRFASMPGRIANTGSSFAFVLSYVIFALMFLYMMADTIITIIRAW